MIVQSFPSLYAEFRFCGAEAATVPARETLMGDATAARRH
jgi:hypothetical protein